LCTFWPGQQNQSRHFRKAPTNEAIDSNFKFEILFNSDHLTSLVNFLDKFLGLSTMTEDVDELLFDETITLLKTKNQLKQKKTKSKDDEEKWKNVSMVQIFTITALCIYQLLV
jgi:hypothetical protein